MPAAKSHSLPNFRHFLSHHSKVWAQLVPFIGLNIHSNLLWLTRDRGEVGGWVAMSCHLLLTLSPPEWLCIKVGSCARPFNVSLIVWAKSQDSVPKPQFLNRKESQSRSNQGPSAYQPSALPLGHTSSLVPLSPARLYRAIQPLKWDSDLQPFSTCCSASTTGLPHLEHFVYRSQCTRELLSPCSARFLILTTFLVPPGASLWIWAAFSLNMLQMLLCAL